MKSTCSLKCRGVSEICCVSCLCLSVALWVCIKYPVTFPLVSLYIIRLLYDKHPTLVTATTLTDSHLDEEVTLHMLSDRLNVSEGLALVTCKQGDSARSAPGSTPDR